MIGKLFTAIKLPGAIYLLYLGWTYWKSKPAGHSDRIDAAPRKSLTKIFCESIVVEVTNPKTALFFLALLPRFVVPESGPVSQQLLVLGIIVTVSALPCDILVAFSTSKISGWLTANPRTRLIQERISGSVLLGLGAWIAADELTGTDLQSSTRPCTRTYRDKLIEQIPSNRQ